MRVGLAILSLTALAIALPATSNVEHALERRSTCRAKYTTLDYCAWHCSGCTMGPGALRPGLGGPDIGCVQGLCINGCQTAIGFDGQCTSHWNDGNTWAYKCSHSSSGTYGMSRWKLKEMGYDCWGGNGGAGEEFWCQC